MMLHKLSLCTESKAFSKSTKCMYRSYAQVYVQGRLTSRPNSREASAKQHVTRWRARSVWATRAASSAKRRSWISLSCVLVWALRHRRLKRLPSRRYLTYTPSSSSKSTVACLSIMLKKILKRVGARTQPCFTPLEMGKGSDRTPLSLIWPRWESHAAGSPSVGTWGDSRVVPEWAIVLTCSPCPMLL